MFSVLGLLGFFHRPGGKKGHFFKLKACRPHVGPYLTRNRALLQNSSDSMGQTLQNLITFLGMRMKVTVGR